MNCNRREWMMDAGGGFAGLALSALLAADAAAETDQNFSGLHHPAKVKRVVQLFMNGGVSPMDTFDPKPRLQALDGTRFDPGDGQKVESVTGSPGFKVLKSPFKFRQYGESGRWVSSVFPHVAGIVDDLTFLMSMTSKSNVHGLASYMQNTGFTLPGFPCLGAWISFALGRITDELPTFVVMPDAKGLPYNNQGNFSAGFLPAQHQGTMVKASAPNPIAHLRPPQQRTQISPASEQAGRRLLEQLNQRKVTFQINTKTKQFFLFKTLQKHMIIRTIQLKFIEHLQNLSSKIQSFGVMAFGLFEFDIQTCCRVARMI